MGESGESESVNSFESFVSWTEKVMNLTTDPTRDFYRYAAGSMDRHEDYHRTHLDFDEGWLFKFFMENETMQCPLMEKVLTFYNSFPHDGKSFLRNEHFIEFCGGFPAFNDNWSSENFDWIKADALLNVMNMNCILSVELVYTDKRVFECRDSFITEYSLKIAEEVLRNAEISAEMIHEIINDVNIIADQTSSLSHEPGHPYTTTKSLTDLKEEAFDYEKYFETFCGQNLTEDDEFCFYTHEYLGRYLNIFSEAQPKTVANCLTFLYLFYFNNFNLRFTLQQTQIRTYFGPVLFSVGFHTFYTETEREKRRLVIDIFRDSVKELCEEVNFDYSRLEKRFLHLEREALEYVDTYFRLDDIEKIYGSLDISPDDYLQNLINVRALELSSVLRKSTLHRDVTDSEIHDKAFNILEFFFKHWQKPPVFYFAGWNFKNWTRVFKEIHKCCGIENYRSIIESLKKQIKSNNIRLHDCGLRWCYEIYPEIIYCLKRSYENYRTWLIKNEVAVQRQDELLKRLNLDSRKLFFVSFMQQCYIQSEVLLYGAHPVIDNLPVMNSEDFAKEFNCRKDARMNPSDKCVIKFNPFTTCEQIYWLFYRLNCCTGSKWVKECRNPDLRSSSCSDDDDEEDWY